MITVYHLSDKADRDLRDDLYFEADAQKRGEIVTTLWDGGFYEAVARVDTMSLNDAFTLTNHIDEMWTETCDERVEVLKHDARSTSVNDLMDRDGDMLYVARIGFDLAPAALKRGDPA